MKVETPIPVIPVVNERRRSKRYAVDIAIHVSGKNKEGNLVEEDTFSINLSLTGIFFISNCDYNPNAELTIRFELNYSLSNDITVGKYITTGKIVRLDHIIRDVQNGKVIKQNIAVNFNRVLGTKPADDVWNTKLD